jgi:predicted anti-sigma-YlaC factor YlaD
MLSAQLDGEDDAGERELVDEHLAGCADCRAWLDRAATVNRLTRTGPALTTPDLSASIMAALDASAGTPVGGAPVGATSVGPASRGTASAASAGAASRGDAPVGAAAASATGRSAADRDGPRRVGAASTRTGRDAVALPWLDKLGSRGPAWLSTAAEWLTRRRLAVLLYLTLAAVGAVQLILGLDQVGGGVTSAHVHAGADATSGHLWHESAAWNVAVGAGYLFIALRRSRPTGLVPMLTAFVGMLLLLSLNDLTGDRVDGTRLVSHGFVILGYLLVVALSKVAGETARPPGANAGSSWRAYFADEDEPEMAPRVPALRLVPRHPGPLTADHDERRAA